MTHGTTRIHIGAGESIRRSGGMHNYILSLASGQARIGLSPYVVDNVYSRGSWRVERASVGGIDEGAESVAPQHLIEIAEQATLHFHFAQSARRLLSGPFQHRDLSRDLFHFHGPWGREGLVQGNSALRAYLKRSLETRVYRRFGRFVTASTAFKAVLIDDFGVDEDRVTVVYPGIDTDRFSPGDQASAQRALGLDPGVFTMACVRRLEPRMGIQYAIEAAALLPNCRLLVVGTGSLREDLESLVERLGLSDRVRFLGRVDDAVLPDVYRASDVTLVPTVALEGFGLIVREAMSAGSPVIATSIGGLPEAMGVFAQSWCVAPANAQAIAQKAQLIAEGRGPTPTALQTEAGRFGVVAMAEEVEALIAR